MKPRDEIRDLCTAFLDGLESILGAKLHAVYLYGAVTFPETDYTGDVDFHVIVTGSPTEAERAALLGLHDRLARDFPPLGAELDGSTSCSLILVAQSGRGTCCSPTSSTIPGRCTVLTSSPAGASFSADLTRGRSTFRRRGLN